ncbi:ABC transporter substrate-binding protein [Myxococcota bacterium]|nr:ABC transporter substrate-binding protein [Myxococcota bacterium]MCZ7620781.1 ABC transporter substrate-binding protein [Myxococcota bacterium]
MAGLPEPIARQKHSPAGTPNGCAALYGGLQLRRRFRSSPGRRVRRQLALVLLLPGLALVPAAPAAEPARHRVATLLPFAADALARIDGPFTVVASVRRDLHVAVRGAADLGTAHAPSLEQLAEVRPTLVIADESLHAVQAPRLGIDGAAVMLLDTRSVAATLAGLDAVGARIGAADAMRRETDAVRSQLAALVRPEPLPTLALFGAPGSFLVLTGRTWLGDLLARLGYRNLGDAVGGDERFPGLLALSDERLSTLRPELLLLVAHGDPAAIAAGFTDRTARGGPWQGLRRSATRGVHVLDPELFAANPGLRLGQAAEALRALAHPVASGAAR